MTGLVVHCCLGISAVIGAVFGHLPNDPNFRTCSSPELDNCVFLSMLRGLKWMMLPKYWTLLKVAMSACGRLRLSGFFVLISFKISILAEDNADVLSACRRRILTSPRYFFQFLQMEGNFLLRSFIIQKGAFLCVLSRIRITLGLSTELGNVAVPYFNLGNTGLFDNRC